MGIIQNYNRIIDLTFYGADNNPVYTISCPRKGQKPNIQITGSLLGNGTLGTFEIKIKNLYMNITQTQFTKVKVAAGYESKLMSFEGEIFFMYRESPGPDGVTTIKCLTGLIGPFLNSTINKTYEKGSSIWTTLKDINKALGYKEEPNCTSNVWSKTWPVSMYFNLGAVECIEKIRSIFPDINVVFDTSNTYWNLNTETRGQQVHNLNYITTPPQLINDGDGNASVVTLTAPWDPTIEPGHTISFKSDFYVSKLPGIDISSQGNTKTISLKVVTLQFQFGTVGNLNSMVIMGGS